jgi:putative membrane protein
MGTEGGKRAEQETSREAKARGAETREHLANERTLLAWVRTGVGLISVGFVVERAGALAGGDAAASEFFGVALVALGCLALIVGSFEFFANRRMIRENEFVSRPTPYMIVVGGSLLVALTFVVYVLF